MSFSGWLADRIILQPTRRRIRAPGKASLRFLHDGGELEVWIHRVGADRQGTPDLYLLEFPGTASRAEDSTDFIEECWSQLCVEIWSVNPPGYGSSSGAASLRKLPAMAERALKEVRKAAGEVPVVVAGGSLGSVSALYLAAHCRVEGVMVQNPPALREVILAQSGWWHFRWATRWIARQVPRELDSIANAASSTAPAVFVTAQKDRIVPAAIQRRIIDAYQGPLRVLSLPDADHDTPLEQNDLEELRQLAGYLFAVTTSGRRVP